MRTLITLLGISLSLALVQTYHNFTTGVYAYMIDCGVRAGSGHIALYHDGYLEDRDSDLSFAPGPLIRELSDVRGVYRVLPRFHLSGLAQSGRGSRNIRLIGVDVRDEAEQNPYLKSLSASLRQYSEKK